MEEKNIEILKKLADEQIDEVHLNMRGGLIRNMMDH